MYWGNITAFGICHKTETAFGNYCVSNLALGKHGTYKLTCEYSGSP